VEAQELYVRTEQMAAKLDPKKAFADWERNLDTHRLETTGCLLRYSETKQLEVNFNFQIESVYQELLGLENLGFSPSFRITLQCTKSHHFYSMASSLAATVKQYNALYASVRYAIELDRRMDLSELISSLFVLRFLELLFSFPSFLLFFSFFIFSFFFSFFFFFLFFLFFLLLLLICVIYSSRVILIL
jgi:hypothetical protein